MLLGSLMEKSRVATLAGLEIRVELRVFPIEEECVVPRQPPHPQVLIKVDRVLSVVLCI